MPTNPLLDLAEKVRTARINQRHSVKSAAKGAHMARDTWKRVEDGKSVHDTTRSAVLEFLGLDWKGDPLDGHTATQDPEPELNAAEMLREILRNQRRLEQRLDDLDRRDEMT